MNFQEKKLYQQIHPAKLFTDWSTGALALYFIWLHKIVIALIVMFPLAIISSLLIVRFVDLEKYKQSRFGKYLKVYMTTRWEVLRFLGYVITVLGAWFHISWLIPTGIVIIVLAWGNGIIFPSNRK